MKLNSKDHLNLGSKNWEMLEADQKFKEMSKLTSSVITMPRIKRESAKNKIGEQTWFNKCKNRKVRVLTLISLEVKQDERMRKKIQEE